MLVSKGWSALMRRNLIYRKRNWIATIAELALPIAFCFVLVLLKETAEQSAHFQPKEIPALYTSDIQAIQILSFTDYVTALQAKRICLNKTATSGDRTKKAKGLLFHNANHSNFDISGMPEHSRNWQVPFIQCDSRRCQSHGEEAYQYCHYPKLGLAANTVSDRGGMQRAKDFQAYVYERYPQLQNDSLPALRSSGKFIRLFESSEALEAYTQHPDYGIGSDRAKLAMAIVFTGNDTSNYDYTIRVNSTNNNAPEWSGKGSSTWRTTPDTNRMFASFAKREIDACRPRSYGPPQGLLEFSCTGQYILNGLLTTQRFLHDWIMVDTGAHDAGLFVAEHGVKFTPFPTRAFQEEGFYTILNGFLSLFLTLGFLYPCASMLSYIAQERETGQKEFLKMMSVKEWEIGTSWFCTFLLLHTVTAAFLTKISKPLFAHSNSTLLWIFWQSALLSFIVFSCFIPSLLAAKPRSASRTVFIGLLTFLTGYFIPQSVNMEDGNPFWLRIICLHPLAAFAYGIEELGRLEDAGVGATWNSFDSTDSPSGFTMLVSLQFFWIDCFLGTLLSWYFNRVFPDTEHGYCLPYSFPLQPSYWLQCVGMQRRSLEEQTPFQYSPANVDDTIPVEPVSDSLRQQAQMGSSVELHSLRKVFPNQLGNSVTAVDGLNLSLYQGQVTALLGHNGSGKSTTIRLLTGSMLPTDGFHVVNGKHSTTQMPEIREGFGICLQQNDCLFPKMTVNEHIRFFSLVKGVPPGSVEEEVDRALRDVGLAEKSHTQSMHLSGGMKRKLCVAIAFCGDSNVIILDEPTSGMDPFSRRFTWNLIRQNRPGKIVLLTTHFLDEADILADKIAILANGRLQCVGSPLFLKQAYDVGYKLTMEKKPFGTPLHHDTASSSPGLNHSETSSMQDDRVQDIVGDAVAGARIIASSDKELAFHLPLSAASEFGAMFRKLDCEIDHGTLSSYGISMTTLDEVFHKVAMGRQESPTHEIQLPTPTNIPERDESVTCLQNNSSVFEAVNHVPRRIFAKQISALLRKRQINFFRDKRAWFFTTILPCVFVLGGFLALKYGDPERSLEPLLLDLDGYNQDQKLGPVHNNPNPVPFNNPGRDFRCQPGWCAYQFPVNQVKETNELYYFCGAQSYLLSSPNCSIDISSRIMTRFNTSDVTPIGSNVRNLNESSHSILRSADGYRDSQYGAIYFTHEPNSTTSTGSSYGSEASSQCHARASGYMRDNECRYYKGLGYVISYNFTAVHVAVSERGLKQRLASNSFAISQLFVILLMLPPKPLFQKLADEATVREAINTDRFSISAAIHPLPKTHLESRFRKEDDVFNLWFMVVLSFPFIAGYMGNFVLLERESKLKHLQTLAGVHPSTYWIATFIWDTMNYQIPFLFTVGLMYAFDVEVFTTTERNTREGVLSLLLLFGPAAASFAYCVSFLFTSASLCNIFIITSGFLAGLAGPIAAFTLRLVGSDPDDPWDKLVHIATAIEWVGRLTPSFCLGKGLFYTINIGTFEMRTSRHISVFDKSILLFEVIALAVQSLGYLFLAICLDRVKRNPDLRMWWDHFVSFLTCRFRRAYDVCASDDTVDDSDTLEEEDRVLSDSTSDDVIVMRQLTKIYSDGKVAVNNISLGIPPGQCFGLLGTNGAGKSTTMGMLSAEFTPTSGSIILAGQDVTSNNQQLRSHLGYCPQFDAVFEHLSGREHVELYAALKCMGSTETRLAADKVLSDVGFSDFDKDRLSRFYSGGMQRKLSLACAMLGDPSIVLFDEPSTGVDPVARREIWRIISNLTSKPNPRTNKKTCAVLTTHSMDECEALCSRIGIMSTGRLLCLGSAHRLKSKFGRGYQLELKVKPVEETDVDFASMRDKLSSHRLSNEDIEAALNQQEGVSFDLQDAHASLDAITSDGYLSTRVASDHAEGLVVFNEACSLGGVSLSALASFAAIELRMRHLDQFICVSFPGAVKRERQDLKVRYEISSEELRLSGLFSRIEEQKENLKLSEYGVSQTSLEQVFNMLAANNSSNHKSIV